MRMRSIIGTSWCLRLWSGLEAVSQPLPFDVGQRADDSAYGTNMQSDRAVTTNEQRLLSLYYGAGLVWSPEVVDRAIIGSERVVDRKSTPMKHGFR